MARAIAVHDKHRDEPIPVGRVLEGSPFFQRRGRQDLCKLRSLQDGSNALVSVGVDQNSRIREGGDLGVGPEQLGDLGGDVEEDDRVNVWHESKPFG
jgi:hypothetical protein